MALKVFNQLSGKKEIFYSPSGKVGIYVCGITPYDVTHIGHAFTYVSYDVIIRYLKFLGYKVTYVQNLTDIDDDILRQAKKEKENYLQVVRDNTRIFFEDMVWLNNAQPDFYVRATDHIDEIIKTTQKLLKKKVAYEKNGSVYFRVSSDADFGKLSKIPKNKMLEVANERGNFSDDPNKENPLDFILWQVKKPGEPSWLSPWGQGRPGWHIECTAMAQKYLGDTFDIHGGGSDLIFPHHEATIAQSENATGKCPYVRYWMETGMVFYQGEKMSKSLGNLALIGDLCKICGPNAVRILLLSHRYNKPWEYFGKEISKAKKMNELLQRVWQARSSLGEKLDNSKNEKIFFEALDDDFDIPKALCVLEESARLILKNQDKNNVTDAKALFAKAFNILGLEIEY